MDERFLSFRSVMFVLASALPGLTWAAEPVLREYDLNHDGKVDHWRWTLDDRFTSEARDTNFDGVPDTWKNDEMSTAVEDNNRDGVIDYITTSREIAGEKMTRSTIRQDRNFDGVFDVMQVFDKDQDNRVLWREIWIRDKSDGAKVVYRKEDNRTKLQTIARAPLLGSHNLTDVVVKPIAPMTGLHRLENGGWIDYHLGLRVSRDRRGRITEVYSWNDEGDVVMSGFRQNRVHPRSIRIRQWDPASSEPKRINFVLSLADRITTGHYMRYTFESRGENTRDELRMFDSNKDGAYDRFYHDLANGTRRSGTDSDYDGLLDTLIVRSAEGVTSTATGDQIPDRAFPETPREVPTQLIEEILKQGRAKQD